MDRDLLDRLAGNGFHLDSTLVPGRACSECRLDGPLETRSFAFDMPMDYRGYPPGPYRISPSIVEVPPSPYCQGWLNLESTMKACFNETTSLPVLYNHVKNCDGSDLKESADGRMRDGMAAGMTQLLASGYSHVSFAELTAEGATLPQRTDLLDRL